MKEAVRGLDMLIVLNGTSSSGKTTLAKAMLELSSRPLLHLEADRFAPVLRLNLPAKDAAFRTRFTVAMHEAIAAFGRSGSTSSSTDRFRPSRNCATPA